MREHFDARIGRLAAAQQGAFSRSQVLAAGGSDRMITRRLADGRWDRLGPGVYALAGSSRSPLSELWRAHLLIGPGSVVSHEAAGRLDRFTGFGSARPVVTVAHGLHPRASRVTVHQIDDLFLHPHHRTVRRGLPVTVPARTLVDLAATSTSARLRVALDDAVAARTTTLTAVHAVLADVARPRKPGVERMARLLDARGPGFVPPQSELERMLHDALEAAGEPPLRRQFRFPGRQLVTGCVDGAYPESKVIVEADGRRWHSRIADLARDHLRDAEAARAGWLVLRVVYEQLRDNPRETAELIRDTRLVRAPRAA